MCNFKVLFPLFTQVTILAFVIAVKFRRDKSDTSPRTNKNLLFWLDKSFQTSNLRRCILLKAFHLYKETVTQGQLVIDCLQAWLKGDIRLIRWLVPCFQHPFSFLFLSQRLSLLLTPSPSLLDVTLYSLPIHSYVFNRMSEITLKDLKPLQWDCVAVPSSLAPSLSSLSAPQNTRCSLWIAGTSSHCRKPCRIRTNNKNLASWN